MEFYNNNSKWKILLAVTGACIVLITMIYSQYLAGKLSEREQALVELYDPVMNNIIGSALNPSEGQNEDADQALNLKLLETITIMPIILENESGDLVGYNYGDDDSETSDQIFLAQKKQSLLEKGFVPLEGFGSSHRIYYENSKLYHQISWFPLAQVLLLGTFVLFGYFVFSSSRKAEQNRVWAGMAKETAHQLGTPISAIIGWIEHLKDISGNDPDQLEVVDELRNDVTRLELIADRFSKIGSKPSLKKINLIEELEECRVYMQRRASKKIDFDFPEPTDKAIHSNINSHLFDWVIENLIRNSLDAMEGTGKISASIYEDNNMAVIELSDTGKGIPPAKQKAVFKPGFTTKKRGWGLGLSLAKRIIEKYHSGKIFVKNSRLNEGTTFAIKLPLA